MEEILLPLNPNKQRNFMSMTQRAPAPVYRIPTPYQPDPTLAQRMGNFLTSPAGLITVAGVAVIGGVMIGRRTAKQAPTPVEKDVTPAVTPTDVENACLNALKRWDDVDMVRTPTGEGLTANQALSAFEKAQDAEERRRQMEDRALASLAKVAGL